MVIDFKCVLQLLDDHCDNSVRCDGGFLDQNCECLCPDGTSDCTIGKTKLNSGNFYKMSNISLMIRKCFELDMVYFICNAFR